MNLPSNSILGRLAEYDAIVRQYVRGLSLSYAVASGFEIEDLVQLTFERAWQNRAAFRGTSEGEFCRWLFAITRSVVVDLLRRQNAESRRFSLVEFHAANANDASSQFFDIVDSGCESPSANIQLRERIDRLFSALESLSLEQRFVVTARFLTGLSLDSITEQLNVSHPKNEPRSPKAVASLLERGLRNLHKFLSDGTVT